MHSMQKLKKKKRNVKAIHVSTEYSKKVITQNCVQRQARNNCLW